MGADELSATLWRERRQLDFLLFLLETQLLHLRAGNWHRLNFTATELEKVLENLRFESLARGVEAASLSAEWKAPHHTTLPGLVSAAPPGPWPGLLGEHLQGMAELQAKIDNAASDNAAALQAGPPPGAPGPDELADLAVQANVGRALAAVSAASLPSLRDFLGPA
ncbi:MULTISPECIES: flagellar protein FlgN [unclassified Paenarthrobacter]|uniref:flagellar protein FlgN n=1 Tax=unclassified Paenarthrobacter TaxID=2634190 RepID=UPI003CFA9BA6